MYSFLLIKQPKLYKLTARRDRKAQTGQEVPPDKQNPEHRKHRERAATLDMLIKHY